MKESNPLDAELIGHRLDLSRSELRPILDRYLPHTALVVLGRQQEDSLLKEALVEDGWLVRTCEGPGRIRCPVLEGKGACYLRESADVAVVYIDGKATWPGSGLLPRLLCAVDAASPAIIAMEGRVDSAVTHGRHGAVGALRSPATLLKAIRAVVRPGRAPAPPMTSFR